MTGIILPVMMVLVGSLFVLATAYSMAVRTGIFEPATVNPFHPPLTSDPAADTMSLGSSVERTTAPVSTPWQVVTLSHLGQVEDLLDSLESHGIEEREVIALQNNLFAVRWR